MWSTVKISKRVERIMNKMIYDLIICKMIEIGFCVNSSDRLVIQNEYGILAYLQLADGSEYWWCDDGNCFMRVGGLRDRMLRYEPLDIRK